MAQWVNVDYPLVNQHNYGKTQFFMVKLTISMAIFNSYVKLPEGIHQTKVELCNEATPHPDLPLFCLSKQTATSAKPCL